jgi:hypothetical protein
LVFHQFPLKVNFGRLVRLAKLTNKNRLGPNQKAKCIEFLKNTKRKWDNVTIHVFDAPKEVDIPYTERLALLKQRMLM